MDRKRPEQSQLRQFMMMHTRTTIFWLVAAAILAACASAQAAGPAAGGGIVVRTVTPPGAVLVTSTPLPTLTPSATPLPPTAAPVAGRPVATNVPQSAPVAGHATDAPADSASPANTPVVAPQPVSDVASAEQAVIDITNQYRMNAGLPPYTRNETVMNIARARVNDMIVRDYYGHNDPVTGAHLARDMLAAAGFSTSGENWYGSGMDDISTFPQTAMTWFINDPPHAAGILSTRHSLIGVGIAWNGYMWIVVQNFASP